MQQFRILVKWTAVVLMFVTITMISCVSEDWVSMGSDIIESNSSIYFVDDLSVGVSTFKYDSLKTSGTGVALVGQFTDNTMGEVKSGSYFPVGTNSARITGENAVFDSILVNFYQSGYHYGDSLINTTINIHRVTEEIEFADNSTQFYNNNSFSYDSEILGSVENFVIPSSKEKITIKLSQEFGEEIFSYLRLPVRPEIEELGMSRFFKGFYVESSSVSNAILGYLVNDTSFYMRVYYHIANITETSLKYDIKCPNAELQFNQITNDSNNPIIGQLSETPVSSDSTNNCGFIQGGSGIFTRIDFPNLREYYQQSEKYQIVKAVLQVCPSKEMNLAYLPQKLYGYYTNKNNELLAQLTNTSGTALDGSLVKDDIFYGKTYYSWDITSFIQSIALSSEVENNGLLLIPQNYNNTFEQLIIADQNYSDSETKLKLYLLKHE